MHHEVKVAEGKQGKFLTDAKGMALYIFKKDSPDKSACKGDCVAKWPLFDQENVGVTGDLKASDFGTITREDGKKQTTYKGMPLYYFAGDQSPGDTKGEGLGDVWYLAKP
jgi:predicted lipoprotein with Yx(FWY)xxD motif